jgi:hypothetical protein
MLLKTPGGIAIGIQVDSDRLKAIALAVEGIKQGLPRVVTRALNKTAAHANAEAIRRLVALSGLKAGDVRRAVRLKRASFRMWRATVRIYNRRIPLIRFGARQTVRGVTFRAPAGVDWSAFYGAGRAGRSVAEHAFIATMPRGHVGVFMRKPGARSRRVKFASAGRTRWSALPIKELYGPSMLALVEGAGGVVEQLLDEAMVMLDKELSAQVKVLMQQSGRGVSFASAVLGRAA